MYQLFSLNNNNHSNKTAEEEVETPETREIQNVLNEPMYLFAKSLSTHRENYTNQEFPKEDNILFENKYSKEDQIMEDILLTKFISVQGQTWQEKLDTLANCKCCTRHQKNKPTKKELWKELPRTNNMNKFCDCSCRHI